MADDADRKLTLRLVPTEGPADPQVLDDLVRLIRQGVVTASDQITRVADSPGYRPPTAEERRETTAVEAHIKHLIAQASRESQAAVDARAELAKQPDGDRRLADEARKAAELVVSAVQQAMIRGVIPRVPDAGG